MQNVETTTTSIRLPLDLLARYDELATSAGRSRNALMLEALREYVETMQDEDGLTVAIEAADRGEFVPEEEMAAFWARYGTPEEYAAEAQRVGKLLRLPE
jgi:predicted transcriptional regulator